MKDSFFAAFTCCFYEAIVKEEPKSYWLIFIYIYIIDFNILPVDHRMSKNIHYGTNTKSALFHTLKCLQYADMSVLEANIGSTLFKLKPYPYRADSTLQHHSCFSPCNYNLALFAHARILLEPHHCIFVVCPFYYYLVSVAETCTAHNVCTSLCMPHQFSLRSLCFVWFLGSLFAH